MKRSLLATLIAVGVVVVLALAAFVYFLSSRTATPSAAPTPADVVAPNSHVLDDGGEGAVTLVEFLDFECEACGAFYPVVEDLREKYAGQITYVIRYFPLPGHLNSMNAAIAVESAAQQGRLEDMYSKMFQTQAEWGEAQESRADTFRGYAEELGLDMAAYDASVADPATEARVQEDFDAGRALGVSSTPTFFVEGRPLELQSFDDLAAAIDSALASKK